MKVVPTDGKKIGVPYLKAEEGTTLEEYAAIMDDLPENHLLLDNWQDYKSDSSAVFKVAHLGTAILVKFYIRNDYFQSVQRPVNSAVHKDNCVEFFIRFGLDDNYYNIEFNCLGVGKAAYGASRWGRVLLPETEVEKIGVWTRFISVKPHFDWEIMLSIPVALFRFDDIVQLTGRRCSANFYVCGDELPDPRYLTWSPVSSAEPDFHRPEYFGDVVFCEARAL